MRRVLRIALRIAGAVVALALVAALAGVVLLQTDWGRSIVKDRVEAALNAILRGRVTIGRIEGGLLAHVVARDVVVRDPSGREALRANRIEARYALLPLLRSKVEISDVELEGVTIDVRRDGGELNLAAILPPPAETRAPSPWTIDVGHAVVRDAAVTVTLDGRPRRVDGITIDAKIAQREGRLSVALASARARWADEDLVATLRGDIEVVGDEARLTNVVAEGGASRLVVPSAVLRIDGGGGSGSANVTLAAVDVRRIFPGTPWVGDVSLTGSFSGGKGWEVHAAGTVARAPASVEARVTIAPFAVEGKVRVDGIDPAAAWATAPRGEVSLEVSADATGGPGFAAMRGSAHVRGDGEIQGNRIDEVVADVTLARGGIGARVRARAAHAAIDVDGGADVMARPIVLRSTRVKAQVVDVSRFLGRSLPVGGDVDADAIVSGPLDDLAASGTVRGRSLAWRDVRVAGLTASVEARGLPAALSGRVRVDARDVRKGKIALGDVRVDATGDGRRMDVVVAAGRADLPYGGSARAHLDRGPDGVATIEVPALTVRTRQLEWTGRAARVTVARDGAVTVAGASLRSAAGAIEASGQLGASGGRLQVDLAGVRIDAVRRAILPEGPLLRGTVDGRVTAVRAGARFRYIRAHVRAVGLAWRAEDEPISVTLDGALRDRDLAGTIAIDGGRSGTVTVAVDARAPANPFDAGAWRRFDARDLRRLRVEAAGVSLARLAEALPLDEPPTGTIHGSVEVGPGVASVDAKLAVAGVTTTLVDAPLAADVTLDLRDGRLTVSGRVERSGGGAAELTAHAAVPRRISDWRNLDLGSFRDSRIALDGIPLAAIPALAERVPDVEGTVSGEVRVDGIDAVTARLTVARARAGRLATPIDAELDASLGADRIHATLATKLGGRKLIDAEVTLAAGLRALRRGDVDGIRTAPATAQARIEALPLALVRESLAMTAPLDGTLDARADLSGSFAAPLGALEASLAGARVGAVAFERLAVSGRLDRHTLSAKIAAVEGTGGTLEATVEVDRRDARTGRARVQAKRFDLAFLVALEPPGLGIRQGVLDADLELDGSLARPAARGSAKITGGELRVAEVLEQLHAAELTATLEPGGGVTIALRSGIGSRGKVELDAKAHIEGLALGSSEGTFRIDTLRVDAGGTRAEVSAAGKLAGQPRGTLYALAVTLESAEVTLPKEGTGQTVHPTGLPADVVIVDKNATEAARPVRMAPFLDVRLTTPGAIAVRGEGLRADLTADLDVTIGGDTSIRGQVTIDGGYFDLFGRHWGFAASQIVFGGETPINPRLALHLAYEFQATTVRIGVAGTLRRPTLELASDSELYDKSQLLGFVLGGSPDDTRPSPDVDLARDAMGTATGLAFGQLQPLVNSLVPIDVISVKQESLPTIAEPTTLLTLGKWFTSDVYVAYRHRFLGQTETTENTHEGLLQYFFWRRWRLDVLFGDAGNGSADVLWVNRW